MYSRALLACYPWRTFYPLSDGKTTFSHRIPMADFRPCLTCLSHSHSDLWHYPFRSKFYAPPLLFWRPPPQSNYPSISVNNVEEKKKKYNGLSLVNFHSTIYLHYSFFFSVKEYSKGAQGLSVLRRCRRIFTTLTISMDTRWRQWGSRYTIHAGRKLPDKEFRYLRTVRVTAAV